MKFIRASERLPDSWQGKAARFIHTKGFLCAPEIFVLQQPELIDKIEWLDESQPALPTDLEQEAERLYPYKGLDSEQEYFNNKAARSAYLTAASHFQERVKELEELVERLKNQRIDMLDYLQQIVGRCEGVEWEGLDQAQAIAKVKEYASKAISNAWKSSPTQTPLSKEKYIAITHEAHNYAVEKYGVDCIEFGNVYEDFKNGLEREALRSQKLVETLEAVSIKANTTHYPELVLKEIREDIRAALTQYNQP